MWLCLDSIKAHTSLHRSLSRRPHSSTSAAAVTDGVSPHVCRSGLVFICVAAEPRREASPVSAPSRNVYVYRSSSACVRLQLQRPRFLWAEQEFKSPICQKLRVGRPTIESLALGAALSVDSCSRYVVMYIYDNPNVLKAYLASAEPDKASAPRHS